MVIYYIVYYLSVSRVSVHADAGGWALGIDSQALLLTLGPHVGSLLSLMAVAPAAALLLLITAAHLDPGPGLATLGTLSGGPPVCWASRQMAPCPQTCTCTPRTISTASKDASLTHRLHSKFQEKRKFQSFKVATVELYTKSKALLRAPSLCVFSTKLKD